ncbi:MAG: hypothetical protein R2940_16260 [Syntrophotaleaceae bacterium]
MTGTMKEAMTSFEAAKTEVEAIRGKVVASRKISAHYRQQLQQQFEGLGEKRQRKKDLLEGQEGAGPEAVEKLSTEISDLERKVSGLKELVDASEAGARRSQEKLYRARQGVLRRRERAMFRLIAAEKIAQLKPHLTALKQAFVAWQLAGGTSDFQLFVEEALGLRGFLFNARNEVAEVEAKLRDEFNAHRP